MSDSGDDIPLPLDCQRAAVTQTWTEALSSHHLTQLLLTGSSFTVTGVNPKVGMLSVFSDRFNWGPSPSASRPVAAGFAPPRTHRRKHLPLAPLLSARKKNGSDEVEGIQIRPHESSSKDSSTRQRTKWKIQHGEIESVVDEDDWIVCVDEMKCSC
ncbi:unnamed protein product [Pleuronectes platessa]|uniref:Uncharacterized protein n=1 Tax=Pleuronectes platessa TaxID=8262 RepID=A0A9N7V2W7_PLEPL|nr:unnamed protein product [Pleuronectes platessa]